MRKIIAVLFLCALLPGAVSAHADGLGITSQFGFSGWPCRVTPSCGVQQAQPSCPTFVPEVSENQAVIPTCTLAVPTQTPCCATSSPLVPPAVTPAATQAPTAQPTARPTAVPQPTQKATAAPTRTPTLVTPSTGDDYTTVSLSAQEQNALILLNSDREANGLPALKADPELCRMCRIKCEDMRDNHYFAHESPTWGKAAQMLRAFGVPFNAVGENIAHHASVERAEIAFLSSPGHRQNIMASSWTRVGVGVCYDENGFVYVTQLFAR